MCYALIFAALLPLPVVFIARHFNLMSDGSNKLSVSYRKTMMKEMSSLETPDESHFILTKPGEAPPPLPPHRALLAPGGRPLDPNSLSPKSCYGTGYQNAAISPGTPITPESDS